VLWFQVVLQAKDDIEHEPTDSVLYEQAANFFVGAGRWAESRAIIADALELHVDDLCRCGRRCIAARRMREGLPPEPPPAPRVAWVPFPRLMARPRPVRPPDFSISFRIERNAELAAALPKRHWSRRMKTPRADNPFRIHTDGAE